MCVSCTAVKATPIYFIVSHHPPAFSGDIRFPNIPPHYHGIHVCGTRSHWSLGGNLLHKYFQRTLQTETVFTCSLCAPDEKREPSCFEHICEHHSDQIGELNCSRLFDCLEQANSDFILNTCVYMSKCNSLWSIVFLNCFYPLRWLVYLLCMHVCSPLVRFLCILPHMPNGSLLLIFLFYF